MTAFSIEDFSNDEPRPTSCGESIAYLKGAGGFPPRSPAPEQEEGPLDGLPPPAPQPAKLPFKTPPSRPGALFPRPFTGANGLNGGGGGGGLRWAPNTRPIIYCILYFFPLLTLCRRKRKNAERSIFL